MFGIERRYELATLFVVSPPDPLSGRPERYIQRTKGVWHETRLFRTSLLIFFEIIIFAAERGLKVFIAPGNTDDACAYGNVGVRQPRDNHTLVQICIAS